MEQNEVYLVAKVDKALTIPAEKRVFPNKETLIFKLPAGIPVKVPDYVGKQYAKDYPGIYSIVSEEEAEANAAPVVSQSGVQTSGQGETGFNAIDFLNNNHPLTKEVLEKLDNQKDLFAICAVLKLKLPANIGKAKQIEHILTEVEVRNQKAQE